MNVYKWYKFAHTLHLKKIPIVPKLFTYLIRLLFGTYIPHTAEIGTGTKIGYGGIGIVIHGRAKIGKNCLINSGVTIGGTNHKYEVPSLGDNVLVGSGAKILGPVKIGNNVVIGANAVVTKDIPDNCLAAGMPATVIKTNINIKQYM